MTDKPKFKPAVTNKKPCEMCGAQIRATKGNDFCEPCAAHINLFNYLWRMTDHERLER